jgi:hypothetical protein
MANIIQIKRRTSGSAGAPASLANGELAFNEVDNTLYYGFQSGVSAIAGYGYFTTVDTSQTIGGSKTFSSSVVLSSAVAETKATATSSVAVATTEFVQNVFSLLDGGDFDGAGGGGGGGNVLTPFGFYTEDFQVVGGNVMANTSVSLSAAIAQQLVLYSNPGNNPILNQQYLILNDYSLWASENPVRTNSNGVLEYIPYTKHLVYADELSGSSGYIYVSGFNVSMDDAISNRLKAYNSIPYSSNVEAIEWLQGIVWYGGNIIAIDNNSMFIQYTKITADSGSYYYLSGSNIPISINHVLYYNPALSMLAANETLAVSAVLYQTDSNGVLSLVNGTLSGLFYREGVLAQGYDGLTTTWYFSGVATNLDSTGTNYYVADAATGAQTGVETYNGLYYVGGSIYTGDIILYVMTTNQYNQPIVQGDKTVTYLNGVITGEVNNF